MTCARLPDSCTVSCTQGAHLLGVLAALGFLPFPVSRALVAGGGSVWSEPNDWQILVVDSDLARGQTKKRGACSAA